MKKFERTITSNINLKEEADKILNLDVDEIQNSSNEDIFSNLEILEAQTQVSSKELEALLSTTEITSLEELVSKLKASVTLHLNALKPEDVPEEIVFSGLKNLNNNADKVAVLKQKEKVWYEIKEGFNSIDLDILCTTSPELLILMLNKFLPKLTSSDLRSLRTPLSTLETAGLLVRKLEVSINKSITTKQLSLEDLENIGE